VVPASFFEVGVVGEIIMPDRHRHEDAAGLGVVWTKSSLIFLLRKIDFFIKKNWSEERKFMRLLFTV
jgi:hypothetical protein